MWKIGLLSTLGIAGALVSLSTPCFAEAQGAEQRVTVQRETVETRPNLSLMGEGLFTFGLAYVPAVVVANRSSLAADHNLYIPVAGPWLDIVNRPACGGGGPDCSNELPNKVLLGLSGVFQGVGALMTVAGLLPTETRRVHAARKAERPSIHISPTSVGTGYGLGATGTW